MLIGFWILISLEPSGTDNLSPPEPLISTGNLFVLKVNLALLLLIFTPNEKFSLNVWVGINISGSALPSWTKLKWINPASLVALLSTFNSMLDFTLRLTVLAYEMAVSLLYLISDVISIDLMLFV